MTSYSVSFPVDNGFLRRECPHCQSQFKWHHGPTEDRPASAVDPDVYFCPYCGETARPDEWWTRDQIEYAEQAALGPITHDLGDELKRSLGQIQGSGLFKVTFSVGENEPEPPAALHEPHDMTLVASPCHAWEPIKIVEDWTGPIHCLICGEQFVIG